MAYDEYNDLLSICSALPGYKAAYATTEGPIFIDIVCWGIFQNTEGDKECRGLCADDLGIHDCSLDANFLGYSKLNPADTAFKEDFYKLSQEHYEIINKSQKDKVYRRDIAKMDKN